MGIFLIHTMQALLYRSVYMFQLWSNFQFQFKKAPIFSPAKQLSMCFSQAPAHNLSSFHLPQQFEPQLLLYLLAFCSLGN